MDAYRSMVLAFLYGCFMGLWFYISIFVIDKSRKGYEDEGNEKNL